MVPGALVLATFLLARNLRVFADKDGAGWIDRLGRPHRFPPGTRATRCRSTGTFPPSIVFVAPDTRKLFTTPARLWDVEQLEALCARTGIEMTGSYEQHK
jgi:hypothetical protein